MRKRLRLIRSCSLAVAAAALLTATAQGAGSLTIAVRPTELVLVGTATGAFTVTNPTGSSISLDASVGNYTIQQNGKVVVDPKLPPQRSAKDWLTISPKRFVLRAHASADLTVRSHPPKDADPGDHHALVLFTTATSGKGSVQVRTRIAVAVLVRVAGPIKRKLAIVGLSASPKKHQLRLTVDNQGNINERLPKHSVTVALRRGSRTMQTLFAPARDILPHARAVYRLRYRARLKGALVAAVTVRPVNGAAAGALAPARRPVKKSFHVHL